jgi:hypothetical protein
MRPVQKRTTSLGIAIVVALCIVALTAGCTGSAGSPDPRPSATTRAKAILTRPTSSPEPAFTPDPYWVTPLGQVYSQGTWFDRGPIEYAEGTVTVNSAGVPVSYTAVSGDVLTVVAKRFDMQWPDLTNMNCMRRDILNIQSLYVGDVLNLDPHTAISVGTEDGHVFTPPPGMQKSCLDGLPPQH